MTFSQRLIFFLLRSLGAVVPFVAAKFALRIFSSPPKINRPPWEEKLLTSAERLIFKNGLIGFAWGSGEKRILLVHGWMGRGAQLASIAPRMVELGYRVIALDGPAHGESPGQRTNVRFVATALLEIDRELGGVTAVIAHSFGAGASVIALSEGLRARCAILVASPSDFQVVTDGYKKIVGMGPAMAASFQAQLEDWAGARVADLNVAQLASRLNLPALIVHDRDDQEVRFANAERLVAHWPGAKLLELTGVGHRKILKAPEFLSAACEFIVQTTAAESPTKPTAIY